MGHHDQANGQGGTWDAWTSPLIDLGERGKPTPAVARWQAFLGRWGPDGLWFGPIGVGTSPTGPLAKVSWRNNGPGTPWREHVKDRGGALLDPR